MDGWIQITVSMFIFSSLGYVYFTLREKHALMLNGMPDNIKGVDEGILEKLSRSFRYEGIEMNTGDELLIITKDSGMIKGIVVGADGSKQELVIITGPQIYNLKNEDIVGFKILSRYGYFSNKVKKRG